MDQHMTIRQEAPANRHAADLVAAARRALDRALADDGKLPEEVLSISGMSGRRYRRFVNNLVESVAGAKYLEIGSWGGSTLCSAIYGNDVEALAIDNWSQFGGPFDRFYRNLAAFKGEARVSFLEKDFRTVDFRALGSTFGTFNVYLFDGPHSFADQYDGIMRAQPSLEDAYVQVVDDWNWRQVRDGTMQAIADAGLQVGFMAEVRTTLDDTHAEGLTCEQSDWHNGYFIAVLSRAG